MRQPPTAKLNPSVTGEITKARTSVTSVQSGKKETPETSLRATTRIHDVIAVRSTAAAAADR